MSGTDYHPELVLNSLTQLTFLGFCRRSADAGKVILESGADPKTQAGLKCRNCANIFICMLHLVDLSICMQKKHESELRAQPYKLLSIKNRKVGNCDSTRYICDTSRPCVTITSLVRRSCFRDFQTLMYNKHNAKSVKVWYVSIFKKQKVGFALT